MCACGHPSRRGQEAAPPATTAKPLRGDEGLSQALRMRSDAVADLKRHHDLPKMLVGFHVLERLADIVEGKHLVDRQLQLAAFHRRPDVVADFVENLADFLDRAGAEGDADIIDAARRMQVEIEFGARAAEAIDIVDSPPN
jgi:hypothetical protein